MTNPTHKQREIIYVWNYRDWGGAQIYFLSLMKEAKNKYRVTALLPSDSEPKILQYLDSMGITCEFLPPSPTVNFSKGLPAKIMKRWTLMRSEGRVVKQIFKRGNPENQIVHIDFGFWQSFLSLFRLCRKSNVFVTVHTGLPQYRGWRRLRWLVKGKLLSRFASFHILASNEEAKDSLKPYLSTRKFQQIEVTYSGIDPDEIARVALNLPPSSDIRQRYELPNNKPLVMAVGQFIERKGCWVLLDSLKQLKVAGHDLAFAWLSTTLPDGQILRRIDNYELGDSFRLMCSEDIGETREDLLTLLSAADIFVLASLQEGLPIALIEAMALGLPCIATNVNAIPEAIENGVNGLIAPPNDARRLADAIITLLDNAQARVRFGAAAKETAFDKFNAKITAERTLQLYDDVWQTAV